MRDGNPCLLWRQNGVEETEYELTLATIIIGREPINDVIFANPEVSRRHARLTRRPQENGYALEDLGSTNGTYVNGRRLDTAVLLKDGDIIDLGETIRLIYSSPQDTTTPALNSPIILPKASSTLVTAEQATPSQPMPVPSSPAKNTAAYPTIDEALSLPVDDEPAEAIAEADVPPSVSVPAPSTRPWWFLPLSLLLVLLTLSFLIFLISFATN